MRPILFIVILFLTCSCVQPKSYFENVMPFKNYTATYSPFVPINLLDLDTVYRIWMFESTTLDRLIVISNNEQDELNAELILFGSVLNKKETKEVFKRRMLHGKDSLNSFIENLQLITKGESVNPDTLRVVYDEPIKHYILEKKINNNIETIYINPEGKSIKLIKDQFNLDY